MSESGPVVVLAGGTGGAKLARGLLDVVDPGKLTVIANTGDDVEIYGAHVSPDPDLISFWLADRIDARGWGLAGDTFYVMDGLRRLGQEVWFNLGDEDLAIGIDRAQGLARGERLTEAQARIVARLGVSASVLPMSDRPVRTRVMAGDHWWNLQEFLIKGRIPEIGGGLGGWPKIQGVQFRGARNAPATPEVLNAIEHARAIVIGPSNPIISIGPILAIDQIAAALRAARAPVVAVSPLVAGQVLKGPTAAFMRWRDVPVSSQGIAELYDGLIDGLVCDDAVDGVATATADLLMEGADGRRRLATATLEFAASLGSRPSPSRFLPA